MADPGVYIKNNSRPYTGGVGIMLQISQVVVRQMSSRKLEFAKVANQIANQLLSRAGERAVQTGTSNSEKPY